MTTNDIWTIEDVARAFHVPLDLIQGLPSAEPGLCGAERQSMSDLPEMCSDEAYEQGCTCTIPFARPNDINPPEPKLDPWCPLHGYRDPDRERDEMIDDAALKEAGRA